MKSMIEALESRTLLSAGTVAGPFAAMQTEMSVVLPATVYTSPVGRYTGTHISTAVGGDTETFTLVIQQWDIAAGTVQFKVIAQNDIVKKGIVGTISGTAHRQFTFQVQSEATQITTMTGKVAANYASLSGTYVTRNLKGVQKDSGTFSLTR